jgi:hypothetical protein
MHRVGNEGYFRRVFHFILMVKREISNVLRRDHGHFGLEIPIQKANRTVISFNCEPE